MKHAGASSKCSMIAARELRFKEAIEHYLSRYGGYYKATRGQSGLSCMRRFAGMGNIPFLVY